ncbi:MAG: hypothetical protein M1834_005504 [Cirrosporium novae-zelandiae]|nr:MAG: hypothetical protein M1834_005504 [Cirrosporium novae-zelandiae]
MTPNTSSYLLSRVFQAWNPFMSYLFYPIVLILSVTIVRLTLALLVFLPLYITIQGFLASITGLKNAHLLLTSTGRRTLIRDSDCWRHYEYYYYHNIPIRDVFRTDVNTCLKIAAWSPHVEEFDLHDMRVRFVHEKPLDRGVQPSGQTIILLHGNPSWSFMWRKIIPVLTQHGHEVYALDWIGYGLSDKPLKPFEIAPGLHGVTLKTLIRLYSITDCYIVAHDWGGCIALSTIPDLPLGTCKGLFLLNSFFLPRPNDSSLNSYTRYVIWFFVTGALGVLLPEWAIMHYMNPQISSHALRGFSAPFYGGIKTKTSIKRFTQILPGIPDFILSLRCTPRWRMIEGLLGPPKFTNINEQATLAAQNHVHRNWWKSISKGQPKVTIIFGRNGPLVDFKEVLENGINARLRVDGLNRGWIDGAGHYPSEDKPLEVANAILLFLDKVNA